MTLGLGSSDLVLVLFLVTKGVARGQGERTSSREESSTTTAETFAFAKLVLLFVTEGVARSREKGSTTTPKPFAEAEKTRNVKPVCMIAVRSSQFA